MDTRRDYIMRMIEQVAICLQRVLGLKNSGAYEEALQEVERASDSLLDDDLGLVQMVDAKTAVRLLGDFRRVWTYAQILSEKGDLQRRLGNVGEAEEAEVRALTLALEAYALGNITLRNAITDEHLWLLRQLEERGASASLPPSQLEVLRTLLHLGDHSA